MHMHSIKAKLIVTTLTIFVVALSALGGLNYWKARSIITENIVTDMTHTAEATAGDVGDWLTARKMELSLMAAAPVMKQGDKAAIVPYLAEAKNTNSVFDGLGYISPDGNFIGNSGVTMNVVASDYFVKGMRGEISITNPMISKVRGNTVVVVAVPVKVGDKVTGVLFATIDIKSLTEKVGAVKVGQTGYAYLVQKDGLTIVHPSKDFAMKFNTLTSKEASDELKAATTRMIQGEKGALTHKYSQGTKTLAFAPVPGMNWSLAVTVPTTEITGSVSALTFITLATIIVVLIITSILIAWFANRIAKPIHVLELAANRIASGDLSQVNIGVVSKDEIGRLGKSFEQMAQNIRGLIKKINANAEQLAASSEQLTANAEQSAEASNQVALAIAEVASGANEQLVAADKASCVVRGMSDGIKQIASNTGLVSNQSEQASDKAKEGGVAIERAVSQMQQIENTVNSSAQVVAKLGERSKEIGQIVDTISGIAGQTNLLALNAAIEAARAGEQGRGFAVVAEEVRKLAEQSEGAAKKIAELIGEIQIDTNLAVEAMSNGTREVKTGADVVNAAGVSFREITILVTDVSEQVKQISAAIQQMASGSQQIVLSVQKIDEVSKKAAGEAQGVSAATEEQLASMEEISASSRALAVLAQDLQTAVATFRM